MRVFRKIVNNLAAYILGRSLRSRFKSRDEIDLYELHEEFIILYGDILFEEWIITWVNISSILDINPRKLRYSDRIDNELAPCEGLFGFGMDDSLTDLTEYIEEVTNYKVSLLDDFKILTIADIILAVHANLNKVSIINQ